MKQDVQNRFEKSTPEELLGEIIPEGGIDSEFYTEIIKLLNEAAYFRREKLDQLLQTQREEIVRELNKLTHTKENIENGTAETIPGHNYHEFDQGIKKSISVIALTPEPERNE